MANLVDSRRLTGPNRLLSTCGCVIDVRCSSDERARLQGAWRENVHTLLKAVNWDRDEVVFCPMPTGASLGFVAPIDALYAATEINECALSAALRALDGDEVSLDEDVERLRAVVADEIQPRLIAMRDAAAERGVPFLSDDDDCSVGHGARSLTWPVSEVPSPESVPWEDVGEIPVVLVTGTNGKTTTVRLLASIASAAGLTPGFSSTDGIWVGGDLVDRGDYSGPGGARAVLRDRRVEFAILETARGGLLRRGVAVEKASASVVLNVSEDHLGEFGVDDLDALCETKFLVTRVIDSDGVVVLNADDPLVWARRNEIPGPTAAYSVDADHPGVIGWRESGRTCAYLDQGVLVLSEGGLSEPVLPVSEFPIGVDGAARHNVSNALAAILLARSVGVPVSAIAEGLASFSGSPHELPGRTNVFRLGELAVLVDFAHNPHGHLALLELATAMPARRRCIVLGQAGDRDDDSIRELVRLTHEARLDRIFVKDMERYLRGREVGEVPRIIRAELEHLGNDVHESHDSELGAVRAALAWALAGDLVVLPVHAAREEVFDLLSHLESAGWCPGDELPATLPTGER